MEFPTYETGSNHARFIDHEGRSFWFSYKTLVALNVPGKGKVVSENLWGPTTGKHLNAIDRGDKASRLPRAAFEARVIEMLS